MKKRLVYLMLCFATVSTFAQEYLWEEAVFAQTNNSWSKIYRMAMSNSDEKVVLGYYKDSLEMSSATLYSSKNYGVFLAKYSSENSLLWAKTIAERNNLISGNTPSIEVDVQGGIYVGLTYIDTLYIDETPYPVSEEYLYSTDFAVLKFDAEGNQVIHIKLEGSCSKVLGTNGIKVDEQESIYLSGHFGNASNSGMVTCDCIIDNDTLIVEGSKSLLTKLNANGQSQWVFSNEGSSDIVTVEKNSIYVAGVSVKSSISFGDYTLNFPSSYDYSGYIAKFDTSGVFHWAKYFGVTGWDSHVQVLDLKAVSENDIVLVGRSFTQSVVSQVFVQGAATLNGYIWGSDDFFIINYDSLGNVHWNDITESSGYEKPMQIASDSAENIYVAGNFSNTLYFAGDTLNTKGGDDVMIVAYSKTGEELWAKQTGGTGSDQGKGIGIDSNGNLYVLGGTSSELLEFDGLSYELSGSDAQMFLAKLKLSGLEIPEQVQPLSIELYPNPNTGTFRLKSEQPIQQVELYSVLGEQVFSKQYDKATTQVEINTKLAIGIYFVLLQTEQGALHAKKMRVE